MNLTVALLAGFLGSSPGVAAQSGVPQPRSNEATVGSQVVFYEGPVTGEQARRVAAILERTNRDPGRAPAKLRRAKAGYFLWLGFPEETWRHPESAASASWAGRLVSAAVFDGAPLTVHVSDRTLESRETLSIRLQPEEVFYYRGEAFVLLERPAEAIEELRKAVELQPKVVHYLLRYGEMLFAEWRDEEAERAFRAALELEPQNARVHYLVGEATFQQGQLQAALPFYRRAVELEPDFARAHEMLASTYDLLGRFDEAIAHYQRAIQLAPSATLYTELGITYRNKKELDEAIARFRAGIELFPDDALLHRNLAGTLVMAGRGDQSGPVWTRALELYRRAAENEPDNASHHASLGFLQADIQDFEGAIASFQRALALEPRAPLTWGGLGDAYISRKRFDDAIHAFLKMVELQGNDGFAIHRLATALQTAGRPGEAKEAFERARQLGYPPQ